jgi:hypothetical protein
LLIVRLTAFQVIEVAFGSKADIAKVFADVRFTSESGHRDQLSGRAEPQRARRHILPCSWDS